MPRTPARCTQADIARTCRAIAQAGVRAVVEIAPDGTIRITMDGAQLAVRPVDPIEAVEADEEVVL